VSQASPKSHALKGTMIGIAPPMPAEPPPSPREHLNPPPKPLRGTMIGMAPPTPPQEAAFPALDRTLGLEPAAPAAANPELPNIKRTMMGIARPGIAPLNPGIEKPHAETASPLPPLPPVPAEPPVAQPWRPVPQPLGDPPPSGTARPLRIPAVAAVAIVGAAALLAAAGVAAFLYHERGAVEATLGTGSDGRDRLSLVCQGCAEGSNVRIGNARASFHAGRAEIELDQKLGVGNNKIAAELERRPGHADQVELSVPVDFRVRADTTGLSGAPPRLIVRVEAVPHAAVVVDGRPLALTPNPSGAESGSAELDVTSSTSPPRSREQARSWPCSSARSPTW
jgi:hypothetical protein